MGKRKRPWLLNKNDQNSNQNESDGTNAIIARALKIAKEKRTRKQRERAERERKFRETRLEPGDDDDDDDDDYDDDTANDDEEEEETRAKRASATAFDEFEARKQLMKEMRLTRPPAKHKSTVANVGSTNEANNNSTKKNDANAELEEAEEEEEVSAALLPPSPFFTTATTTDRRSSGKHATTTTTTNNNNSIERARNEATRNIQHFARVKQLSKATNAFRALVEKQRVNPSVYTYCALLNAYANAGRTKDVEIILKRMARESKKREEEQKKELIVDITVVVPECKPNVVAFTMLLKSYLIECDVIKAKVLIKSMVATSSEFSNNLKEEEEISQISSGVGIDSRALNTFYRVCLRTGDVSSAIEISNSSAMKEFDVSDDTSKLLLSKMFAQSFNRELLAQEIESMQASIEDCLNGKGIKSGLQNGIKERQAPTCLFWKNGECQRGKMCKFFHDRNVKQKIPEKTEMAQKYLILAQMNGSLAKMEANLASTTSKSTTTNSEKKKRKKASLSAIKACQKACKRARDFSNSTTDNDVVGANSLNKKEKEEEEDDDDQAVLEEEGDEEDPHRRNLFRNTNRSELERDMARLKDVISRDDENEVMSTIDDCFSRCLLFTSKLGGDHNHDNLINVGSLFDELRNSLGLDQVLLEEKRIEKLKKRLNKTIDSKSGYINFKKLFKNSSSEGSPEICLEVAAGNGEWSVAQATKSAAASKSTNNNKLWIASELRRDRSCDIFNKICVSKLQNIAVISGDAFRLLDMNIEPNSLHRVFINFPEPPHHSGDEKSRNDKALLNKDFFLAVHRALKIKTLKDDPSADSGGLTIYSDNERYMHTLAKLISSLTVNEDVAFESEKCFGADQSSDMIEAKFTNVEGVRLYNGCAPGKGSGFETYEESFFDRFWQAGSRTDRFFLSFSKKGGGI